MYKSRNIPMVEKKVNDCHEYTTVIFFKATCSSVVVGRSTPGEMVC